MHFINQHGTMLFCQLMSRINIKRIGGGGNHNIRSACCGNLRGMRVQAIEERKHVADAPHAVSFIGIAIDPKITDSVDILLQKLFSVQRRVLCAQMGKRAGCNRHLMPHFHPALGHEIRTEFHTVLCASGVVVNQKNIHCNTPLISS